MEKVIFLGIVIGVLEMLITDVNNREKKSPEVESKSENLFTIEPDYFSEVGTERVNAAGLWNATDVQAKQATVDANYLKVLEWRKYPEKYFKEVLGFDAWTLSGCDDQVDIANAIRDNERVSVRSGNGPGKTVVSGAIVHWFLECFYPSIVITTAPTHRQVEKLLWGQIRSFHKNAKIPLGGELLKTELRIEDDWYALGFATDDKSKFQGFHSPHMLVVVDEAGGMEEHIMEAIEGLLTSEGAKLLLIGNPTNIASYFGRTHLHPKEKLSWTKLHIDCWNTPNVRAGKNIVPGLCSYNWPAERLKVWGENHPFYMVKVKGEFPPEGEKNLIPYHLVHAALERNIKPAGQKILTVDPARFGDDKSIIGRLWGEQYRILKKFQKLDGPALATKIIEEVLKEEGIEKIKVDEIGEGASCYDALKLFKRSGTDKQKKALQGIKLIPVRVNEKSRSPKGRKEYGNLRAEAAFLLRNMFEEGTIDIDDEELASQAAAIYYDYDQTGRLLLEDKKKFKSRYQGNSPDEFDSLLIGKVSELAIPGIY